MIAKLTVLVIVLGALTFTVGESPSRADVSCPSSLSSHVGHGDTTFGAGVGTSSNCSTSEPGGSVADPAGVQGTWHREVVCGHGACVGCADDPNPQLVHIWFETTDGRITYDWTGCPEDAPLADGVLRVTEAMVANAFQRIPLPASPLIIQPPGGKTLVNFRTNFYTKQQELDRTVRLLGQRIDLRISVASYTWHFDDGHPLRTTKPGAPYPHLQITHNYLRKGGYRPSLDTTYVADYRVNGGAWHTVPGSVTIAGDARNLRAIEARPVLVG